MNFLLPISQIFAEGLKALYELDVEPTQVLLNPTKKEFKGDYTIAVFSYSKEAKKTPAELAESMGNYLISQSKDVASFNVVNGFLNLELSIGFWQKTLASISEHQNFGKGHSNGEKVLVEFSSPNTNKPLHLGHIRNILLGWSLTQILEATGYEVIKTQIINDRGIAICKSMLAWEKYGEGTTPEKMGIKSDHFVGDYYVLFETKFQEEYQEWQKSEVAQGILKEKNIEAGKEAQFFKEFKNQYFNQYSALGLEAREMLQKWESSGKEVLDLWKKMNTWVYEGFEITYKKLGVSFDKNYYESDTYLLGKETVDHGIK